MPTARFRHPTDNTPSPLIGLQSSWDASGKNQATSQGDGLPMILQATEARR
jgi:hypothetical protein